MTVSRIPSVLFSGGIDEDKIYKQLNVIITTVFDDDKYPVSFSIIQQSYQIAD